MELVSEGAALKLKKTFGKMKVQGTLPDSLYKILHSNTKFWSWCLLHWPENCGYNAVRKVKMDLDPPIGCSFSSLKSPMVKLGFRLSNVKSTLSSEWEAIHKVRVSSQIPANDSFSHQSLAYVYASTRYLKEVSGLLKTGVSTFHNSSSSYEVVQGMKTLCFKTLLMCLVFLPMKDLGF